MSAFHRVIKRELQTFGWIYLKNNYPKNFAIVLWLKNHGFSGTFMDGNKTLNTPF